MASRVSLSRRSLALALLPLALVLSACPGAQQKETAEVPLEVKLRRVEVADASFEKMDLLVVVAVANPTSADLSLTGGNVSLAIDGQGRFGDEAATDEEDEEDVEEEGDEDEESEGETEEDGTGEDGTDEEDAEEGGIAGDLAGIVTGQRFAGDAPGGSLAAFKETEVPIRVSITLPQEPEALERLLSWRRMSVDVNGTLATAGRTETFAGKRDVATPILPKVVLQEAQVASIDGGQKGAVYLSLGIDNPNTFPIYVDRFAWSASIGGKELRQAGDGSREPVPPSSVAAFEDSVQLNEETYGPDVKKLLSQPRVPYRIEGFFEVRGIRKPFVFEGEMEFAR